MPDEFDRASEREQLDRDRAIAAARASVVTDPADSICPGCSYASRSSYGRTCEAWTECLQDYEKRKRAAR